MSPYIWLGGFFAVMLAQVHQNAFLVLGKTLITS